MRLPREVLFGGAALGAILALGGVLAVGAAWAYPHWLISSLGASVTPEDITMSFYAQLGGTLAGLAAAAVGLAVALLCFRALSRDEERLRGRVGRPGR